MSQPRRVAVIGAGIGGMAAAYDLVRAGCRVTIFESSEAVGGLAGGFTAPGWDWSVEKFYHHWFASDHDMLDFIAEQGWSDRVIFRRPYTVVYYRDRFYPFDSIKTALLFPGLGWGVSKVRFGLVGLFLRLTNNWRPFEMTTVDTWMRRWAGERAYGLLWEPLLVGKFGPHYRQVNMAWMWARLKSRTTRLGTFQGGFQAFCDALADRLRELGVEIRLNSAVQGITLLPEGGLTLALESGSQDFDQVLATTSPALLARLAPDLPPDYLQGLLSLRSMGAVVMVLALHHPLSPQGYYWYNLPKQAGFPFLALVEHTNFLSPEYFGGEHIVYVGDYLDPDHEHFRLSKEQLLEKFVPALSRINPAFKPDWVRASWLYRTAYAQPIPEVGHSRNIPAIQTPLPGLFFASMSQVYPWDRGTNFAVEIGRRAARMMLSQPASPPPT